MRNLDRVRAYVEAKRKAYENLLDIVSGAAKEIEAELGGSYVLDVYGRGDKQGGEKLKEVGKILDAAQGKLDFASLQKIDDIIGVTIVVQYTDQIPLVLDILTARLASQKIAQIKRKLHQGAYYATHAIYESRAARHQGLRCEVQCKTLLHDAWAAKMHDLTYKPQGSMDVRLRNLVEAISTTLEGLEQQSQTVRDIIAGRQLVERLPFQETLKVWHAAWAESLREEWREKGAPAELETLWAAIEAAEVARESPGTEGEADLDDLGLRIRDAARAAENLRICWIMAVKVVALTPGHERLALMLDISQMLFEQMPKLMAGQALSEMDVLTIPFGYYLIQDFNRALEYADRLLDQADDIGLSEACRSALRFNKATWLLERESLRYSRPWVASSVKREVSRLLSEFRRKRRFREGPEFTDTDGLRLIVFGCTKEDVRRGIQMCADSVGRTQDANARQAATAYADWRAHLGWRRYFELAERAG